MQVLNIQSTTFQGVHTPANFSPTATQERMIKTIKNKLTKDTAIFKKDKNFHDYLESKNQHFLLSNGEYKDEIKVELGRIKDDVIIPMYNLGSYPESRLDGIVKQLKDKRQVEVSNENWGFAAMLMLGLGMLGMALLARK